MVRKDGAWEIYHHSKEIEMNRQTRLTVRFISAMLVLLGFAAAPVYADPGLYLGGSVGGSDLKFDIFDEVSGGTDSINEDQIAWKLFAGYRFNTQNNIDLAIEGGFVELTDGEIIVLFPGFESTSVDLTTWDVFGVFGVNAGPVGLFGKAGLVFWDGTASVRSGGSIDDSGTDLAYGIGARANLGPLEFRLEYENFDIDAAEDIYMTSLGLVWNF